MAKSIERMAAKRNRAISGESEKKKRSVSSVEKMAAAIRKRKQRNNVIKKKITIKSEKHGVQQKHGENAANGEK